jgi:hypothetical protein
VASRKPKGPPEKVLDCGIEKDEGYVYFVDRRGNLLRMQRGVVRAREETVIEKAVAKREKGYMYYLDDDGDLWKEPD